MFEYLDNKMIKGPLSGVQIQNRGSRIDSAVYGSSTVGKWEVMDISLEDPKSSRKRIDRKAIQMINKHLLPSNEKTSQQQRKRSPKIECGFDNTHNLSRDKNQREGNEKDVEKSQAWKDKKIDKNSAVLTTSLDYSYDDNSFTSFIKNKYKNVNVSILSDCSIDDYSTWSIDRKLRNVGISSDTNSTPKLNRNSLGKSVCSQSSSNSKENVNTDTSTRSNNTAENDCSRSGKSLFNNRSLQSNDERQKSKSRRIISSVIKKSLPGEASNNFKYEDNPVDSTWCSDTERKQSIVSSFSNCSPQSNDDRKASKANRTISSVVRKSLPKEGSLNFKYEDNPVDSSGCSVTDSEQRIISSFKKCSPQSDYDKQKPKSDRIISSVIRKSLPEKESTNFKYEDNPVESSWCSDTERELRSIALLSNCSQQSNDDRQKSESKRIISSVIRRNFPKDKTANFKNENNPKDISWCSVTDKKPRITTLFNNSNPRSNDSKKSRASQIISSVIRKYLPEKESSDSKYEDNPVDSSWCSVTDREERIISLKTTERLSTNYESLWSRRSKDKEIDTDISSFKYDESEYDDSFCYSFVEKDDSINNQSNLSYNNDDSWTLDETNNQRKQNSSKNSSFYLSNSFNSSSDRRSSQECSSVNTTCRSISFRFSSSGCNTSGSKSRNNEISSSSNWERSIKRILSDTNASSGSKNRDHDRWSSSNSFGRSSRLSSSPASNDRNFTESEDSNESMNNTYSGFSYSLREDENKRKILKRIKKTKLYSSLVDIDSIFEAIEERIIGKHDYWIHSQRRKILILGDSHTRFLVFGLQHILPGFTIEAICKPSAKSEQVISGMDSSIGNLTKGDFLILLCGTNDMWGECIENAKDFIYDTLGKMVKTNVLLCNVPQNYSESKESHVQDNILEFNNFLKIMEKNFENVDLVRINELKDRRFFTKHGLHFNATGKIKICELMSHKIVDVMDRINI